jgi:hypothetical protein
MPEPADPQEGGGFPSSKLFTLRVWREDLGHGQAEWRGQLEHVLSGEAHYFRDWQTMLADLQDMLGRNDQDAPTPGAHAR